MDLDLPEIESSKERADRIRVISSLAKVLFVLVICTALFNLYSSYKLFKASASIPDSVTVGFKINFWANIIFLILYGVMLPLQTYFFYQFIVKLKSKMQNEGANQLNGAFRFLLYQTIVAVLLFGMNSLWAVVSTFFLGNE